MYPKPASLGLSKGVVRSSNFFPMCKAGICAASCGGRDPIYRQVIWSILQGWCFLLLHGSEVHRLPSALLEGGHMYIQSQGESLGTMLLPNLGESFPEKEKGPLGGGMREVSNRIEIHLSLCLRPHGTAEIYSTLYSGGKQWPLWIPLSSRNSFHIC